MKIRSMKRQAYSVGPVLTLLLVIPSGYAQTQMSQGTSWSSLPTTPTALLAQNDAALTFSSDELPDAPSAQTSQAQPPASTPPRQDYHTQINPIALLSPRFIPGQPLTAHDKFEIYIHKTYSPAAVIYPLFGAGFRMARPNNNYPEDWQDGAGAFGRNYGDAVARRTAKTTSEFTAQVLFHEDPRYGRSTSTNAFLRVGHAVGWTFVDKSDSGHSMLAISTFTGAAAGGFVGMAYLPDGFDDINHAKSRVISSISGRAISNVITEFEPTWGPVARKLHIRQILPSWWTSDHK